MCQNFGLKLGPINRNCPDKLTLREWLRSLFKRKEKHESPNPRR